MISVVIPCYNSESTIEMTLDSVANQTYKDFEIILVDDGSFDGTKQRIEAFFKNKEIAYKYIYQTNRGVSSARNRGIRESSGEYIAFLDSDDLWHPQKLEIVSEILQQKDIDILGHAYTLKNNFKEKFSSYNLKQISFFYILLKNFAVTPGVTIRREKCLFFDENMRYTEDHDLWLRVSLQSKLFYVDLPLVMLGRVQLSQGGLSADRWAMRMGELQMYKNIAKRKKILIFFLPLLFVFSLMKHLRKYLKKIAE